MCVETVSMKQGSVDEEQRARPPTAFAYNACLKNNRLRVQHQQPLKNNMSMSRAILRKQNRGVGNGNGALPLRSRLGKLYAGKLLR